MSEQNNKKKRKIVIPKKKTKIVIGGNKAPAKEYLLPTVASKPSNNLNHYSILCYGAEKIGKTSLFGRRKNSLYFMFEPGAKAQTIAKVPIEGDCFTNWRDVMGYVRALKKGGHDYEAAIFDTGLPAYELCLQYYCTKAGIVHPGKEKDFGASWHGVNKEFQDIHLDIASIGMGFCVLGHEKYTEITGADGKKYDAVSPAFSKACSTFYKSIIDLICWYRFVGSERYVKIRGDETTTAGCRIEHKFLTPKGAIIYDDIQALIEDGQEETDEFAELSEAIGNEQIHNIPMGNNANMSYANFMKAFNNQQVDTLRDLEEDDAEEAVPEKTIKKKKKKYNF